jgi:hypothetical protein
MNRFLGYVILAVILILAGFFYFGYYRAFGEGVKSGELNFFVKKGYVFKTYEGKLIQSGFKSKVAGTIQSNEFDFSVTSESVAKQLMMSTGKEVDLHYREYLHTLPWRGYNKYIVDSIIAIREIK